MHHVCYVRKGLLYAKFIGMQPLILVAEYSFCLFVSYFLSYIKRIIGHRSFKTRRHSRTHTSASGPVVIIVRKGLITHFVTSACSRKSSTPHFTPHFMPYFTPHFTPHWHSEYIPHYAFILEETKQKSLIS